MTQQPGATRLSSLSPRAGHSPSVSKVGVARSRYRLRLGWPDPCPQPNVLGGVGESGVSLPPTIDQTPLALFSSSFLQQRARLSLNFTMERTAHPGPHLQPLSHIVGVVDMALSHQGIRNRHSLASMAQHPPLPQALVGQLTRPLPPLHPHDLLPPWERHADSVVTGHDGRSGPSHHSTR